MTTTIELAVPNRGVLRIESDQAFFTAFNSGVVYTYSHNHLAPGHKPVAWSLFDDAAYAAHCAGHGCATHPTSYLWRAYLVPTGDGVELLLLVHELVQTGGGGYRCERRSKTASFSQRFPRFQYIRQWSNQAGLL